MKNLNNMNEKAGYSRRDFIVQSAIGGVGLALSSSLLYACTNSSSNKNESEFTSDKSALAKSSEKRKLGSLEVTTLGFGV
jgi:hypothetical protein